MTAEHPIVAFLRARLDEEEQTARAVEDNSGPFAGQWEADGDLALRTYNGWVLAHLRGVPFAPGLLAHIARHDPARVLREVEADRKLIERYEYCVRMGDCPGNEDLDVARQEYEDHVFPLRAARFSDHPEYAALHI